jgi:hypothetical protein
MKALKNIPEEIDYSQFKWLRRGDRIKIAAMTNMSESMVRATLRKKTMNVDILLAAMKRVVEIKTPLLEAQAEAQRFDQYLKMKVA